MRRMKIINAAEVRRTPFSEAANAFYKHCRVRNLRPRTITYYKEDLTYFHGKTGVKYADEITQEVFDEFIFNELEAGKKTSSLNTRIRGLRVFFTFCAEREYMRPIHLLNIYEQKWRDFAGLSIFFDKPEFVWLFVGVRDIFVFMSILFLTE